MNYNIALIDDGIGSVEFMRELKKRYSNSALLVDNKNYPYSLRKKSIFAMSIKLLSKLKAENYIVTNPAIAVNLEKSNRNVISGLKRFYDSIDASAIVLTNKYFADYLKKMHGEMNSEDAQILSNQVQTFGVQEYVVKNILDYYLKGYKNVYFMDSNFYVLKDFILDTYSDKNIYFIQDFIMDELKDLNFDKNVKNNLKIFVTADRRSTYLNLEDIYGESYVGIKNIVL
ncbi:Hypothetical protein ING2D1G_0489 [Peptoniphilus sp. ING2-D1G]|nr:Hypothetical protein ING2D1G_0489 [Peptoniphilus sp. ING2-D1G]